MTTPCTEPIVELQVGTPPTNGTGCSNNVSASSVVCGNAGVMKDCPPSQDMAPAALVTERRGASIDCWIVISWSIRLRVVLSTELIMVEPPGEPYAAIGSSSLNRIVGAMLDRGRLNGATSFAPGFPVAALKVGAKLKSVSSLFSRKP